MAVEQGLEWQGSRLGDAGVAPHGARVVLFCLIPLHC